MHLRYTVYCHDILNASIRQYTVSAARSQYSQYCIKNYPDCIMALIRFVLWKKLLKFIIVCGWGYPAPTLTKGSYFKDSPLLSSLTIDNFNRTIFTSTPLFILLNPISVHLKAVFSNLYALNSTTAFVCFRRFLGHFLRFWYNRSINSAHFFSSCPFVANFFAQQLYPSPRGLLHLIYF